MAVYRYQVVSVGLWRGKIKRWNTTFHLTASNHTSNLHNVMQATCYPNPGDATGACSGGVASISVYNSTGGAPISVTTYFDWQTPTSWIPFLGTVWSSLAPQPPIDASGESALVIVGNMGGLSSTGKPVTTRKYIHAVPSRSAANYSDPDIDATVISAIEASWGLDILANPAGVQPVSFEAEPYYFNHQRVRGRRRTTSQVAQQSFSAGVAVGAGAATGGGLVPFREEQAR